MQKIDFLFQTIFEIFKLKQSCNLISQGNFFIQPDFSKTWYMQNHKLYDSVKTIKVIIMLQAKPKNAHINGLNSL